MPALTPRLQRKNWLMASEWQVDGLFMGCHDLLAFGSTGATVAAANSRYVWIVSADHPANLEVLPMSGGWSEGGNIYVGFSSDPGIPPKRVETIIQAAYHDAGGTTLQNVNYYHYNDLVYNPDDPNGYVFYIFCEIYRHGGSTHESGLVRTSDFVTMHPYGITHDETEIGTDYTSFHRFKRLGTNNWISVGSSGIAFTTINGNPVATVRRIQKLWTSTNGRDYHYVSSPGTEINRLAGDSLFADQFGPISLNIGGQEYIVAQEDARHGVVNDGLWITLAPVDSGYNVSAALSPDQKIRLTEPAAGVFPSFSYLQAGSWYVEDGILHLWAVRGYFSDLIPANPYANAPSGDGQHECAADYYTVIVDATAAASAAPVGVRVECHKGMVILEWYDALPNRTYRIKRSTNGGSTYSTIASSVTGLNYADPAGNVGAVYYYKVVYLNSGVEAGERIVSTYVSFGRRETNSHVTRVLAAGGTGIDVAWVEACFTWLWEETITDRLMHWADPAFGRIETSGHLTKIFSLGGTLRGFSGDFTPTTSLTTYSATGVNGVVPAWVNGSSSAYGYFGSGRLQWCRRMTETTWCSVYQKPGTGNAAFMADDEFGGISLIHESGSPGNVKFNLTFTSNFGNSDVTVNRAASSATSAHIAIGAFDGVTANLYLDGVASSGTGSTDNTLLLDGARPRAYLFFLGSGSLNVRYSEDVTDVGLDPAGYVFTDAFASFSASDLIVFDIGLSSTQANSLNSFLATRIGGASYSLPSYSTPVVKNIKTDYGAVGNDSTDDAGAFMDFNDDYTGYGGMVVLQVPAGTYRIHSKRGGNEFSGGLAHFLMLGEHRDSTTIHAEFIANGDQELSYGTTMLVFANVDRLTHSSRIATVAAGAISVTLVDHPILGAATTLINDYTVGKWILISGLSIQSYGQPPNHHFFEWAKISVKSGVTLTLDRPLKFSYKSTWPSWSSGNAFEPDPGGPATIYAIVDEWDHEHEYRHFTNDQPDSQTKAGGRFAKFNDALFTGVGVFATENFHWEAEEVVMLDFTVEMDKVIEKATIKGGNWHGVNFQSTSPNEFWFCRGAVVQTMNSTPRRAYLNGFYISAGFACGPTAYGCSDKCTIVSGTIANWDRFGGTDEGPGMSGGGFTMSGGVITVSKLHDPVQWANPGSLCLWTGSGALCTGSFHVIDITESGPGFSTSPPTSEVMHIQTDQTGGFPPFTGLSVATHPCPVFTARGIADPILDNPTIFAFGRFRQLSHAKPFKPLYSQSMAYHDYSNINQVVNTTLFGKINSIKVAVTRAYTGIPSPSVPATYNILYGDGSFYGVFYVKLDGSANNVWNPTVDLFTAGTRSITTSGVTGSGGADANLTPPANPLWIRDNLQPYFHVDISPSSDSGTNSDQFTQSPQLTLQIDLSHEPMAIASGGTQTITASIYSDTNSYYAAVITGGSVGSFNIDGSLFLDSSTFFAAEAVQLDVFYSVTVTSGGGQTIGGAVYGDPDTAYVSIVSRPGGGWFRHV